MEITELAPGQILRTWHDTGCMGPQPVFYRVLKVARVKVRVRGEHGDEGWRDPAAFDRIMPLGEVAFVVWR